MSKKCAGCRQRRTEIFRGKKRLKRVRRNDEGGTDKGGHYDVGVAPFSRLNVFRSSCHRPREQSMHILDIVNATTLGYYYYGGA